MKIFKIVLATFAALAVIAAGSVFTYNQPAFAATTTKQEVCDAIGSKADCSGNKGGNLTSIVKVIINVLSLAVGIVAVIMIIVAGFKYITSGGDTSKVTSAKNALIYAINGLIIVALAQFIVRVVQNQADKVTINTRYTVATITLK